METTDLSHKLTHFKSKVFLYDPVPVQCPLTLDTSTGLAYTWVVDTNDVHDYERERIINPNKIDSESEDGSDSDNSGDNNGGGGNKEASLKALEVQMSEVGKVQKRVGVTFKNGKVYLWCVGGSDEMRRAHCDSDGKFAGLGKDLSKTLLSVALSTIGLDRFLSSSTSSKKLPSSDYSAYAPFWSDRPAPKDNSSPLLFENFEAYGSEATSTEGKLITTIFLVDPSQSHLCGLVTKPVKADDQMEVKVFVFSEYEPGSAAGGVVKDVGDEFEIDVGEFFNKRVKYVK